jgi:hypothetical protein
LEERILTVIDVPVTRSGDAALMQSTAADNILEMVVVVVVVVFGKY